MGSSSFHQHQLSLDIPHTNNPRVFRIFDTSIYSDKLPVVCGILQITPPGFIAPTNIEVMPNFNIILNACSLGLQAKGCGDTSEMIPDGIYKIRYSDSPNDKVFVEYEHLRITQFNNKYNEHLCSLELAACEPEADIKDQLKELYLIDSFIKAAKVKIEDCHDNSDGMDLFKYAQKRLAKLDGDNC